MDYQMGLEKLRAILPPEFPILDINGPWLEFTKIPQSGDPVEEFASRLKSAGTPLESSLVEILKTRLPTGRLYKHQERAIEAILAGKSVVLPHPTGSGKTEAFVIPALQYMLTEIRSALQYGLGCLMIFPMKALENDQRDRLKGFLYELETRLDRIPFIGVYDGDTPTKADFERTSDNDKREALRRYTETCPRCGTEHLKYNTGSDHHLLRCEQREDDKGNLVGCGYPEDTPGIPWIRVIREDMRNPNWPNLLITNPEALDFRLLSYADKGVFQTKMPRVMVVIDEAHAYSASAALNLRFLLSRLEQKVREINGNQVEFQYIISSATLDDPGEFAHRLVPWATFEVIPFTQRPAPFDTPDAEKSQLGSPIVTLDLDQPEWFFNALGKEPEQAMSLLTSGAETGPEVLTTLTALGIAKLENGKLEPGFPAVENAWAEFEVGNTPKSLELLKDAIRARFVRLVQVSELYKLIAESPRALPEIVTWWSEKWKDWPRGKIESTITALVLLGRRLQVWEERWHLFVKSPTGIAACSGDSIHVFPFSGEEPIQNPCPMCGSETPVFEIWTCMDCAEIYYVWYLCDVCGATGPDEDAICKHSSKRALAVSRQFALGKKNFGELGHASFEVGKGKCARCDGKISPVRRRTDLIIDMSVSLVGWHTGDIRKKFLLFTDSRSSSERIGREFNNMEYDVWAERLLMHIMREDPDFERHAPRLVPEVRRKLFARLFRPYNVALQRLLRKNEQDRLDRRLNYAAFRALGKSTSGTSRLFEHGLLGYSFDDLRDQIDGLDLGLVLPRVVDIIRIYSSKDGGVKSDIIVKHFFDAKPKCRSNLQAIAGSNNEKIERSLEVLMEGGWIRRIQKGRETRYFFNEGDVESSEDPFSVARDVRKLAVPREVSRCGVCGFTLWYLISRCESCDEAMRTLTHEQLISEDYFAGVLVKAPRPIVAAIHRGGLEPMDRRLIEDRFRSSQNSIHFLCATPTLELGIDVGYLNFVLLSRVPPTRTNYIQRVGRAGRRRSEGAICVTFTYPTPIDAYYFRNPRSLVSMRTGRLPVQQLAREHLRPHLWATVLDALSLRGGQKSQVALDSKITTRAFLEGQTTCSIEDLRGELSSAWEPTIKPWIASVVGRCIIRGTDQLTLAELDASITQLQHTISVPSDFGRDLLRLDAFAAQKSAIDSLHLVVAEQIRDLRAIRHRSRDQEEELDRLEVEDTNLQAYKKRHMMASPLLMYLHSIGSVSSTRGIGPNVLTYDLGATERTIDDRGIGNAIPERFPGALISRQGTIYRVKKIVYDPLERPPYKTCKQCDAWLKDDASVCPDHPASEIKEVHLEQPVVSFAEITWLRSRETRGRRQERLRPLRLPEMARSGRIGDLALAMSHVQDVQVASLCEAYDTLEEGHRLGPPEPIVECANCRTHFISGVNCCSSPSPRTIVQGLRYKTRGMRIDLDWKATRSRIDHARRSGVAADSMAAESQVSQSLANALLNSFSITLDVEPSMLDAVRMADDSIWLFEPIEGGYGLLDEIAARPAQLERVFAEAREIVRTRPGEHECPKYCDQCLIVPRYSRDELLLLNRPLLAFVLESPDV